MTVAASSIVIRGGRMLDIAGHAAPLQDVLVQGGRIAAIGQPGMNAPPEATVFDASDRLLMPGLINAHSHGHGALAKGLGDLWTLELLLNAGPWINGGRSVEDKYLSAQLGAAEMVLKGCTAVYDLYAEFPVPTVEGMAAVAQAYADVGMRAVIAPMVADRSLFEAIPGLMDALPEDQRSRVEAVRLAPTEAIVSACRDVFAAWTHDRDRIRPAVAPTIPLHCTRALLEACRDLAATFGLGLHSHVAESRIQAVAGIDAYGITLTGYLDSIGLIGPDFTVAHGVWLDDDDLDRLASHGASVAHNPGSNLRLGSGIAAARRMLERGVNVGIGTDGAHCSDNQNMFEAMRIASFVSRVNDVDTQRWITTAEAAQMATAGSARALGLGKVTGTLAAGFAADIVLLDLGNINFVPFNDPTNQIVHSEDGSAVDSVMIDGKWVLRNRTFVNLDYARLRRQVENAVERLRASSAAMKAVADKLAGYVAGFCLASHRDRRYGIHRLCTCNGANAFVAAPV